VDWYPWGPEAFAKAKAEGKPIFLSVGYSTCYWCHVMERESFENPEIARLLNTNFVCVKVDREERPDVDQVYMAALQVFGRGGWPMSVFLTPDGRPFFGGTYFPPENREGHEGFPSILNRVIAAWREHRPEIERDADRLSAVVRQSLDSAAGAPVAPLSRESSAAARRSLVSQFDPDFGGFGFSPENPRRPKFPEPVNLFFLLDQHRRDRENPATQARGITSPTNPGLIEMVAATLDHMARGGIRDQLAGGYHRYATRRDWSVPHFEKMLYDNAQLASMHLLAFQLTGERRWREEAEATFAFVARTLTSPEGAFYSALDAETGGEEGAYYVWSLEEVRKVLGGGPGVEAFVRLYGLDNIPNFEKDRFVLLEPSPRAELAAALNTTTEALELQIAPLRKRLLSARDSRPSPLRDDKILTSWNGLMIAAYADGFRVLKDPRYRDAAVKAAEFVLGKMRTSDGRLLRSYREGRAKLPAYLEDYACMVDGLLTLQRATGERKWLEHARALTDRMVTDFADPKGGGFYSTAGDHEDLLARPKDALDNVLPSGNSVAVRNLVALAAATHEPRYLDLARKTLDAFSTRLAKLPEQSPIMLIGLNEYLDARPEAAKQPVRTVSAPLESESVVTIKAHPPAEVTVGNEFDVALVFTIEPGWHLYANPTGIDNLPPTRVTLDPGQGASLVRVDYPAGIAKVLESSGKEKVSLYEGVTTLTARIKFDSESKKLPESLEFTAHYQACNERACLAPAKASVRLTLKVTGEKAPR
jgi:uncharacterized protein YyaL (SSP411 family)